MLKEIINTSALAVYRYDISLSGKDPLKISEIGLLHLK
jgi:hypothetical protein